MTRDQQPVVEDRTLPRCQRLHRGQDAQSLIEVAIFLPVLVLLVFYAVDFGYFFIVSASLSSSARNAVLYSVQGTSSPLAASTLPAAGPISDPKSVAAMAVSDLSGLAQAATVTSVQVCFGSPAGKPPVCQSFGIASPSYTPDPDPEPSLFHLNRVDVVYTVQPPIPINSPLFPANLLPRMTFHRMAEMRVMNN